MGQVDLAQCILKEIVKWAKYYLAHFTISNYKQNYGKVGQVRYLAHFNIVSSTNAKLIVCIFLVSQGPMGPGGT